MDDYEDRRVRWLRRDRPVSDETRSRAIAALRKSHENGWMFADDAVDALTAHVLAAVESLLAAREALTKERER